MEQEEREGGERRGGVERVGRGAGTWRKSIASGYDEHECVPFKYTMIIACTTSRVYKSGLTTVSSLSCFFFFGAGIRRYRRRAKRWCV